MKKKEFVNNLSDLAPMLDPENVVTEYRLPKDFKEKTGMDARRFWHLWKNPEEQMTLPEAQALAEYFSDTSGKSINMTDFFAEKGNDTSIEDVFSAREAKKKKED
ncbi:MAG: hypothetical protein MUE85_03380 [Microscillaceae bacterium]|jgi:hypothetical protein|nr:hypothetical protein [Microscillaceae bacterium]